ncbi:MAG TPA: MopE-related protein [Saprospiraceae bacterium]|nr:MopE-related protein [Saprospiraceae bacterium]
MKIFFTLTFICFLQVLAYSTTITSTTSGGNWSSGATWQGGIVPGTLDTAVIITGTVIVDVMDTVAQLSIISGQIKNDARLTVTGKLFMTGGNQFGLDTLHVMGLADFTSSNTKKIGGRIKLSGGGTWNNGTIDFTLHPMSGGSNVAPIDQGGTIYIIGDTLNISNSSALTFKTNNPKGLVGSSGAKIRIISDFAFTNTGVGMGMGGDSTITVYRCDLADGCGGAGGSHCNDGEQNNGETGIDCGGTCPNCPDEPEEDETDDDTESPSSSILVTGIETMDPGGYLGTVGSGCNTNETSGNQAVADTIFHKIYIGLNSRMVFNSSTYLAPSAKIIGKGTFKVNNSIFEMGGTETDTTITVSKFILNNGSVLKGQATIGSRTLHSLKSTIKSNVNIKAVRLALDNSFLVGAGETSIDSFLVLKGTVGNTLNRPLHVKYNAHWKSPKVSFAVDGKITIDTSGGIHIINGTSTFEYSNGKGPVIDNKGDITFHSNTSGKFLTTTFGNGIWNTDGDAKAKHCLDCNIDEPTGENGGNGGGGSSEGGEVDNGGGGVTSTGCVVEPVPDLPQMGCFNMKDGILHPKKGNTIFGPQSCVTFTNVGQLKVSANGNVSFENDVSSTNINVTLLDNAVLSTNSCLNTLNINLSANTTMNFNTSCTAQNVTLNGSSTLGGNGDLTVTGNLIVVNGKITGTRNINVNGDLTLNYGMIKNQGDVNVLGDFYGKGGSIGDGVVTGTMTVADSSVFDFNPVSFKKKVINLNGHTKLTGEIQLANNAIINIGAGTNFSILGTAGPYVARNITGSSGEIVNNYGTIIKDFTGQSNISSSFNNFGNIQINSHILSFSSISAFEAGSTVNVANGATLDYTNGTNHSIKTGSSISGSGNIRMNSCPLMIESGANIGNTMNINNVSGTLTSNQSLSVANIDNSSTWLGTHNIVTSGYLRLNYGVIKNQGDVNVLGDFYGKGGSIGDGVVTGTMTVADSSVFDFNPVSFKKKVINLNGHTKLTGEIQLANNAIINIGAGTNFSILGTAGPYVARNITGSSGEIVNNYGTIIKDFTGQSNISSSFNNFGNIQINSHILSFSSISAFEAGSTVNVANGATLDYTNGTNHSIKTGSSISGSGNIRMNSCPLMIESGANIGNTMNINNVSGTLTSNQSLSVANIDNSSTWLGTHNIVTSGYLRLNSGVIKNLGDMTIGGKFLFRGGTIGDGSVTGNVTVADSTFINYNPVSIMKKNLYLNGHTWWKNASINLTDGAGIILADGADLKVKDAVNSASISTSSSGFVDFYGDFIKESSPGIQLGVPVTIYPTSIFKGNGQINNLVAFTNHGTIAPGLSPGTMKLSKFPTGSDGILEMEIGGNTMATKDSIYLFGPSSTLVGDIQVNLISGFVPDSGQVFSIIQTANSYTGTFDSIFAMGIPSDSFHWTIIYEPNIVKAKYCPMWYPDLDGDGYGDLNNNDKFCSCTYQPTFVRSYSDCDDADPLEFPGQIWYFDNDGDGYGGDDDPGCERPVNGFVLSELMGSGDCDDGMSAINPGAIEVCDGIDNNCNGNIDTADGMLSLMVVSSSTNGPGSLKYIMENCMVNDSIYFDSQIGGDTIKYTTDSLVFTTNTYLLNNYSNPVIIEFDQTTVSKPIQVLNANTEVTFKGLNFVFKNNADKCSYFLQNANNKIRLEKVESLSIHPVRTCGAGHIEIHNDVSKVRKLGP